MVKDCVNGAFAGIWGLIIPDPFWSMTGKEKKMEIQEYDKEKNNEVTERIITIRLNKNLKSKDVAIQMGVTDEHYSRLEAQVYQWNLKTLYKVSQILEVSMDTLLTGNDESKIPEVRDLFRGRRPAEISKAVDILKAFFK